MAKKRKNNIELIKGKNGKPDYYIIDVTFNYKRIKHRAGRTKAEATEYLAKLRLAARDGKLDDFLNRKKIDNTFKTYARALLDSSEWKKKRSAKRNEVSLNHLNKFFKDKRLEDINPGEVRKYRNKRESQHIGPATINREISLLKSILQQAEYDGVILSSQIKGEKVKKLDEPLWRGKALLSIGIVDDYERQAKLLECASADYRPIFEIALITGMRQGEILKMKWEHINFNTRSIRIPEENSKTKKERFIPIDANLAAILDSIERKGDYVFMSDRTGKRRKDIRKAFKAACDGADIPVGRKSGITFHDLRHLAAYRLVKVTDLITASKILGHADVKMTMRYVHPTEHDQLEAIEKTTEKLISGRKNNVNFQNIERKNELKNSSQLH